MLERALTSAEKGGRLTHQLPVFARYDVTQLRRVDQNAFLESIVEISTQAHRKAGLNYTLISVIDNDVGMTPEVAAETLEPFFTTRNMAVASGLGLSQVYGLATSAGASRASAAREATERWWKPCCRSPLQKRSNQ